MLVNAYSTLDEKTRHHLNRFAERFAEEDGGILVFADQSGPMSSRCKSKLMADGMLVQGVPDALSSDSESNFVGVVESFRQALREGKRPEPSRNLSLGHVVVRANWGVRLDLDGLNVNAGECVGLVGLNGAGKSTLIEVVANIIKVPKKSRCRAGSIGLAWGTVDSVMPYLNPNNTRQLDVPSCLTRSPEIAAWDRFRWLYHCALAGVDHLVLDEPTIDFDGRFRELFVLVLREFRELGCSVVLASHDLELIAQTASRTVWLAEGRVNEDGITADVLDRYRRSCGAEP